MRKLAMSLMTLALVASVASAVCAEDWNLERDMSATANPNGAWTAGVFLEDALEPAQAPWVPWTAPALEHSSIPNWFYFGNAGPDLNAGCVSLNPTTNYAHYTPLNLWLAPGDVGMFAAGYGWAYAPSVRWTAPRAMTISISALYTGHSDSVSCDVHVLLNGDLHDGSAETGWLPIQLGTQLLNGFINGNVGCPELGIAATGTDQSLAYNGEITVAQGDYIDFWTGFGSNLNYGPDDHVALEATITEIPEPGSMLALGTGILGLAGFATRRRRA